MHRLQRMVLERLQLSSFPGPGSAPNRRRGLLCSDIIAVIENEMGIRQPRPDRVKIGVRRKHSDETPTDKSTEKRARTMVEEEGDFQTSGGSGNADVWKTANVVGTPQGPVHDAAVAGQAHPTWEATLQLR